VSQDGKPDQLGAVTQFAELGVVVDTHVYFAETGHGSFPLAIYPI